MHISRWPLVVAAVCGMVFSTSAPAAAEESKPWREITSGTQSGIEAASHVVIQSQEPWRKWWLEHTKNQQDPANPDEAKPPMVDFDKETVLVATMGMRSTGGYQIRFSELRREGKSLKVFVTTISPGADDLVATALTYPFSVIAIPKHEGPIEFVVK